jgi:alanyl-tRNA synthetase
MGLERLAAVMQGVHSNYDIDLFQHLLKAVAELANCQDLNNNSLRVIADHIRACAFLIVDGIIPSNEGRGYVLRRIIRRAVRHGHKLGLREPFFYKLVNQLDEEMGSAYPELSDSKNIVSQVLKQEEERFADTVHHGLSLLEQNIAIVKNGIISGDVIFKLYDTYGFPADLTADIARERGLTLDMAGFEKNMAAQRALSCAASHFECDFTQVRSIDCQSEFIGYENIDGESCVKLLFYEDKFVENLQKGQSGRVIVEQTPFYAESGGQVGDKGVLIQGNTVFEVQDTQKTGKAFVHSGQVISGEIRVGTQLLLKINVQARQAIARNHTATHLLHAALRQILGHHVKQKGSLVEPERLRFDFSHFEPVSDEQLAKIEGLVNAQILRNSPVHTQIMTLDDAMNSGAMALFGEKYAEKVRVLSIADFSTELCGGTHVKHTGDIGLFKIVMETGVAAGVRRIEAMTGYSALEWVAQSNNILNRLAYLLKGDIDSLENRVMQLLQQNKENEKEISRLQSKLVSLQGGDLASQTVEVNGIKVLAARLDNGEVQQLRDMVDQLKNKLGMAAIVLALVKDEKVFLVAGVTENLTNRVKAGDLVNYVAQQVGGKGGGRADMAQAGGKDVSNLATALKSVPTWVKERL